MTNSKKTRAALTALPAAALAAGVALPGGGAAADVRTAAKAPAAVHAPAPGLIDPRAGGLQVALGEWSIGIEAKAVRPGLVTFVVANRGKFVHGLEIERVRGDDEDSDSDIDEETEDLRPGQTGRLTLRLSPGVYEIECSVSNHDDLGMKIRFEVREDAPFLKPAAPGSNNVAIRNFAYAPKALNVKVGTTVKWKNVDAAPHTVTGTGFGSNVLNRNGAYSRKFARAGTYAYICALHPAMKGSVVVK
jgi:plastocyanin